MVSEAQRNWHKQNFKVQPEDGGVLYIADGRIKISASAKRITADYHSVMPCNETTLHIMTILAEAADVLVPDEELVQRIYGYNNLSEKMAATLKKSVRHNMKSLRHGFGEELGDSHYGAVRNIRGIGFAAVSSLSHGMEDITIPPELNDLSTGQQ